MRIYVECTFGEIDRRWGILWRPLEGKLENHKYTIDSCMRMHNFIVDWRENDKKTDVESGPENSSEISENEELNVASDHFMIENMYGLVGGILLDCNEEELRRRGRRTEKETRLRNAGNNLRKYIKHNIWQSGLRRPKRIDFNKRRVTDRHHRVLLPAEV